MKKTARPSRSTKPARSAMSANRAKARETATAASGRGLRLLGHVAGSPPRRPTAQTLDTFANAFAGRDYQIRFDCPEFTSLCPVTGQADFGRLRIEYVPDRRCLETKSLKFYLASYRHTRSFNEEVVNRILDDLVAACRPRRMTVHGEFASRGGIAVTVVAAYPAPAVLPPWRVDAAAPPSAETRPQLTRGGRGTRAATAPTAPRRG